MQPASCGSSLPHPLTCCLCPTCLPQGDKRKALRSLKKARLELDLLSEELAQLQVRLRCVWPVLTHTDLHGVPVAGCGEEQQTQVPLVLIHRAYASPSLSAGGPRAQ